MAVVVAALEAEAGARAARLVGDQEVGVVRRSGSVRRARICLYQAANSQNGAHQGDHCKEVVEKCHCLDCFCCFSLKWKKNIFFG